MDELDTHCTQLEYALSGPSSVVPALPTPLENQIMAAVQAAISAALLPATSALAVSVSGT